MGMLSTGKFLVGFNTISGDRDHLTRFNVPYKLSTNRSQCTALRCKHISIAPLSKTERLKSQRITHTDQFTGTHDHQCIGTL